MKTASKRALPRKRVSQKKKWRKLAWMLKQNTRWEYKFILHGATVAIGPGPPPYRRFFTVTLRRTTLGKTPLDE